MRKYNNCELEKETKTIFALSTFRFEKVQNQGKFHLLSSALIYYSGEGKISRF